MNIIIKKNTEFDLTQPKYQNLKQEIKKYLQGKVKETYFFWKLYQGRNS